MPASIEFQSHFPKEASEMRVTGLPPLQAMVDKADAFHNAGKEPVTLEEHPDTYLYPSATISALSFFVAFTKYHKLNVVLEEGPNPICYVGDIQDAAKLVMQCIKGYFGGFESHVPNITEASSLALTRLDAWTSVYLSMHVVHSDIYDDRNLSGDARAMYCTCPGYSGDGTCWHMAHCLRYISPAADDTEGMPSLMPEEEEEVEEADHESSVEEEEVFMPEMENEEIFDGDDTPAGPVLAVPPMQLVLNEPWVKSFEEKRHGLKNTARLCNMLASLHENAAKGIAIQYLAECRRRSQWRFELAKAGTSRCQACRELIPKGGPRLAWCPGSFDVRVYKEFPGYDKGSWHVGCAVLVSKLLVPCNYLIPITPGVVVMEMSGANPTDALVINNLVKKDYKDLRALANM